MSFPDFITPDFTQPLHLIKKPLLEQQNALGGLQTYIDFPELTFPYDAYGDSITTCPSNVTGVTLCYSTILAAYTGWTRTGHGHDGDQVLDTGALVYAKAITTTGNQRFTIMIGTNDQRLYLTDATKRANYARALRLCAAWLLIPDTKKILGTDTTNITYVGGSSAPHWQTTPVFGKGRNSQTAGDTATFTVVGKTVYVASIVQESNAAGFTVTIDGVTVEAINCDGTGMTTHNGATFGPVLYRYSGLSDGPHTVVLTVTSGGAAHAYLEWVAGSGGVVFAGGPRLIVGTIPRANSTGYSSFVIGISLPVSWPVTMPMSLLTTLRLGGSLPNFFLTDSTSHWLTSREQSTLVPI